MKLVAKSTWCDITGDVLRDVSRETCQHQFVAHFCAAMRCPSDAEVTRIEFRFTSREPSTKASGGQC